jgi:hypothetical protein
MIGKSEMEVGGAGFIEIFERTLDFEFFEILSFRDFEFFEILSFSRF